MLISLYLNICYGEKVEMQMWVSNSIVPVCLLLSILYIVLYLGSDLISKEIISGITIFLIILTVTIISIGVFSLFKAISVNMTDILSSWQTLSKQSQIYYYNNDVETLYKVYRTKMIVTGVCFIILSLISIINVALSFVFLDKLNISWRPPLIARLSDERALRYINYYNSFSHDPKEKNLNVDKEEEKLLSENEEKKVENILDVNPGGLTQEFNIGQLQFDNKLIEKDFNDMQVDKEKKENKSYLNNLRRKNKDSNQ
jgi:hypothetical protein